MTARVALVLVSHSALVAQGTADLAREMAPDVALLPAGGIPEGIGTSAERVQEAVEAALAGSDDPAGGVVVITDLGSAVLTSELVLELLDEDQAARVRIPAAPFVEGAVSAAVTAQQGGDLDSVAAAAVAAGAQGRGTGDADGGAGAVDPAPVAGSPTGDETDGAVVREVVVRNPMGLHARPAAVLAGAVATTGVAVTVDGADGASMLALMALGATAGRTLTVRAEGPGAAEAVDAVVAMIEEGFGEL